MWRVGDIVQLQSTDLIVLIFSENHHDRDFDVFHVVILNEDPAHGWKEPGEISSAQLFETDRKLA